MIRGEEDPLEKEIATHSSILASPVAQTVKHLLTMQETRDRSLGREIPLEKEMATHCSILAWNFHGRRSPVGYSRWGRKESDLTEQLTLTGRMNSSPAQLVVGITVGTCPPLLLYERNGNLD